MFQGFATPGQHVQPANVSRYMEWAFAPAKSSQAREGVPWFADTVTIEVAGLEIGRHLCRRDHHQRHVTSWNQLNADSVVAREVPSEDALELRALVEEHQRRTGSVLAKAMLADWTRSLSAFRQLVPISVAYPPAPAPIESLETAAKTTP